MSDHANGDPCPTCDVGENAPNPACASWVHPGNGPSPHTELCKVLRRWNGGHCTCSSAQDEPTKMGARVRDRDGDTWRRGRTRWTCEAHIDGERVTRVGRLPWSDLARSYGPLSPVPGSSAQESARG